MEEEPCFLFKVFLPEAGASHVVTIGSVMAIAAGSAIHSPSSLRTRIGTDISLNVEIERTKKKENEGVEKYTCLNKRSELLPFY